MINIICVAVRLKSNRLKRKALLDLNGVTLIERLIERLLSEFQNDEIEELQNKVAEKLGYKLVDHRLELYGIPIKSKE